MAVASATLISPSSAVLPLGSVIGRKYRIDAVLVEGGMGIVYRGYHLTLEKSVAIKVVRPEFTQHTEAVARFLNEARATARLRGIHVAQVLDTGRIEEGPPYMVLEYLQGCDLRALLDREGALPVTLAADYVLQAAEAIAEAHGLGIVHRDLKPENLFLTRMPDGTEIIKVIDFGISKRLDHRGGRSYTAAGQTLGSPHYMAPEQMTHPEQVGQQADIWSLGVVLYELLTARTPHEGDTLHAVCANVCCGEPIPLSDTGVEVPAELEAIVTRCLQKDPKARFENVHELSQALAPFGSPTSGSVIRRVERLMTPEPPPALDEREDTLESELELQLAEPPGSGRLSSHRRLKAQVTIEPVRRSWLGPQSRQGLGAVVMVALVIGLGYFFGSAVHPSPLVVTASAATLGPVREAAPTPADEPTGAWLSSAPAALAVAESAAAAAQIPKVVPVSRALPSPPEARRNLVWPPRERLPAKSAATVEPRAVPSANADDADQLMVPYPAPPASAARARSR